MNAFVVVWKRACVWVSMRRALSALILATLLLSTLPALEIAWVTGTMWPDVPPTFTDEGFYHGHVQNIATKGHFNDGNPYFIEHASDAPLVIFGGAWVNALPQLLGIPIIPALYLNFLIFSLAFVVLYFWLFRELRVPQWLAAVSSLVLYLQSYAHVWRPANLQPVYPDLILFYIGIVRLIKSPSRGNVWLLGLATGASFYLFSYLWQIAVITLGILFLYTLLCRHRPLMWAVLKSSFIGGVLGSPIVLYTWWLSHASPYFLESISRFGLVYTHLPMAEVLYSGGWVGAVLLVLAVLWWRVPALRDDVLFRLILLSLGVSGLGLWVMQGSNLITGVLVETGEHLRLLILPWLVFATTVLCAYLWNLRTQIPQWLKLLLGVAIGIFVAMSLYYTYDYTRPFFVSPARNTFWLEEQAYAGVFEWLEEHEQDPVVVWGDPHETITQYLPMFTRHYTLFTTLGMWHLVPQREVEERYLISQYFSSPTVEDLKNDMPAYLGREHAYHKAKTIERGIKLCRLVYFWNKSRDCGTVPTPVSLLGEEYFTDLERQFTENIKPNILSYLVTYHVSYILKDTESQVLYEPEKLGAVLVWSDDRYELFKIPQ